MNMFCLENTCKFCIFIFTIRCCIFSAYYDIFYWSWVVFFCNLHAYSAYLQYMEDTGRSKMRQKIWSFRGFRTKYLGLECPSGIFPRYSLRQCKCWLNGMVTSKNGIIHRRYCICPIFCNVLLIMSFLLIMSMFLANTCIFFISKLTIPCCIFSAHHDIVYCSWKDLVAMCMQILHICSTWKTRDGRKCAKNFGVLGVSGLNK